MSSEGEGGNHNVPREGNIPEIVAKAAHFQKWCQRQRVSSFSCLSKMFSWISARECNV